MNKELILKYKIEFDNWLNGGKLLAYYKTDEEPKWWTDKESINYDGDDNFSNIIKNSLSPSDVLIVIDDAYVEFRKALAEGKIVEFKHPQVGYDEWEIVTPEHLFQSVVSGREYRIKPEEPKFKTGDWVIHNGEYKQVTKAVDGYIDSLDNEVAAIMKEESLELWEPKEKEYFWYKNDLVKFDEIKTNCGTLLNSIRGCSYYPAEENFEDYCEPFIGQLPTILKD